MDSEIASAQLQRLIESLERGVRAPKKRDDRHELAFSGHDDGDSRFLA
jgi:hypothetical protein